MYYRFYREFDTGHEKTVQRVEPLLRTYAQEQGFEVPDTLWFAKNKNGKPQVKDLQAEFSVSHTDGMWVCVIDSNPVGVDLQFKKKVDYMKIARRFFTAAEIEFCKINGSDGFYQVWTAKEAAVKYFGITLAEGMSVLETVEFASGGTVRLSDTIRFKGETIRMTRIRINGEALNNDYEFCVASENEIVEWKEIKVK